MKIDTFWSKLKYYIKTETIKIQYYCLDFEIS